SLTTSDRDTCPHRIGTGRAMRSFRESGGWPDTLTNTRDRSRLPVRFAVECEAALRAQEWKSQQKDGGQHQTADAEPFAEPRVHRLCLLHRDFLQQRLRLRGWRVVGVDRTGVCV